MTLTEKAAYLKGIADGMKLNAEEPVDKLLLSIIDMLDDVAKSVTSNEEEIELLTDDVDALYEDVYDDDEDDEDDDDLDDEDEDDEDEDDEDDDDEELYEIECPKCGEKIYLDFDEIEQGDITCPACGETLEIELHTDDCDCGCCHHDESDDE